MPTEDVCGLRRLDEDAFDALLPTTDMAARCKAFRDTFKLAEAHLLTEYDASDPGRQAELAERIFALLGAVAGAVAETSAIESVVTRFCREAANESLRIPVTQSADYRYGHVIPHKHLQRLIEQDPVRPESRTDGSAEVFVDELVSKPLSEQQDDLKDIKLRRYLMWICYQPSSPDHPFSGVTTTRDELRRRLGLGFDAYKGELLYGIFQLPSGSVAYQPTSFDAELNIYFRPGGKTHPLDGAEDGLHEAVHAPLSAKELVAPLVAAKKRAAP